MNRPAVLRLEDLRRAEPVDARRNPQEREIPRTEWNAAMERAADPFMGAKYVVHRGKRYWVCDSCSRDCNINSCGKCGATGLRKVEA